MKHVFVILIVIGLMTACENRTKTKTKRALSETDSIKALYKNTSDTIPPKVRWCTELFPKKDTSNIEELKAGALTVYKWK